MEEDTAVATIEHEITSDFILDLYEKYNDMDEGADKKAFLEVIKVLSDNLGDYLVLKESEVLED